MLKYLNTQVVFQEFPGETTLAINLTGCKHHCPGCHSPQLWEDIGEPLTLSNLCGLIDLYKDFITCVGFMGGDAHFDELTDLVTTVRMIYPGLRYGWYSGNNSWSESQLEPWDYVKFGSYKKELGGLNSPTTNQRMFKRIHNGIGHDFGTFSIWLDITKYFWKDTPDNLIYIVTNYGRISMLYTMLSHIEPGTVKDGYEIKIELPTLENFVKGHVMYLNGQEVPDECKTGFFWRNPGEMEWTIADKVVPEVSTLSIE